MLVRRSLVGLAMSILLGAGSSTFASAAGSCDGIGASVGGIAGAQLVDDQDRSDGSKSLDGSSKGLFFESSKKALKAPKATPKAAPVISWLPEGKPKVALLCVHGFSLHKGCFLAFGKEMAKDGVATYAMDLRGFGELKEQNAEHTQMDFDGMLVDLKACLERIHREQPGVPVIILGESMGGAVALRVAALYPDLVSGLIAAVPARDRYGFSENEAKIGLKAGIRTLFGGYSKPMDNAALAAVQKISQKEDLRKQWAGEDPMMRTDFSARDFVQFDEFMSDNLAAAAMVKDSPVLFIQGTNDKLIRPAGTWKLFERLSTPNRQMVLSKNSEHLIFEEAQFKPEDINFVTTWIDRNVASLGSAVANRTSGLPVVASQNGTAGSVATAGASDAASARSGSTSSPVSVASNNIVDRKVEGNSIREVGGNVSANELVQQLSGSPASNSPVSASVATVPQTTNGSGISSTAEFKHRLTSNEPQINFWIELNRDGKTYRCNNKMEFKSGDKIKFHLIPGTDGYAYLVMKAGTTGKSDVLFPNATYGTENYLYHGKDYSIPKVGWMQFDQHPGTEQLGLVFANVKVDVTPESLKNRTMTAFVSHDQSGSKDLCPTRMKLSWDDPMPVVIPDDFSAIAQVQNATDSSLVRLAGANGGMVSASISLMHNNNSGR